jgi:signal transduction histidine kinase
MAAIQNQPYLSVRTYFYVFLCYAAIIVCSAFLFVGFFETREMSGVDARLASAARAIKYMLADDFHDRAVDADAIGLDEELRNRKAVTSFARDSGLVYLYTLVLKDGRFYFSAPTVTAEEAGERERWYFYPYADAPPMFEKALRTGREQFSTYSDQWGTFRSVAVPEVSPGGVRYLACADMDISAINGKRLKDLLLAAGAAFVLIISSLPLLFLFNRNNRRHTEQLMKVNRELTTANERLLEMDALKSSLLSKVSHELRTPLTSIMGFAKLMVRDIEGQAALIARIGGESEGKCWRMRRNLSIIVGESERLTRLINDNLDLFKIESGKMEWRDEPLAPAALVESALCAVHGECELKPGVSLHAEVAPSLPMLFADPDRMQQVFLNLLTNAIKFTEQGGVVFSVSMEGGLLKFEVSDTGVGIAEQDQECIFDELFRAMHRDTVSDSRKGTGLGLAICSQIVAHYGGTISVCSRLGKGSTFTVLLKPGEPTSAQG